MRKLVLFGSKFCNFRSPALRLTTAKAVFCGPSLTISGLLLVPQWLFIVRSHGVGAQGYKVAWGRGP